MTTTPDDAGCLRLALLRGIRACIRASQAAGATRDGAGRFILEQFDRTAAANPDDDWKYLRSLIERAIEDELYNYHNSEVTS